ncbi:MAG: hypothetical protein EU535_08165, partial [Promethearchaeota archaeon]
MDYNDPRLVYVEPSVINIYGRRLVENFYKFQGKNIRFVENTTTKTLEYGRKLCSGRECLPMMAIAGAVLKDINENRREDEITIYRLALEQSGPCQNGGWPALWEIFAKELKIENTIFSGTLYKNKNYMGLSLEIYETQVLLYMIGHFITEVKNALYIVARNPNKAIEIFEKRTDELILKVKDRKKTLKQGLKEWAREISKIPLDAKVEDAPKILIIGGLNLLFTYYP